MEIKKTKRGWSILLPSIYTHTELIKGFSQLIKVHLVRSVSIFQRHPSGITPMCNLQMNLWNQWHLLYSFPISSGLSWWCSPPHKQTHPPAVILLREKSFTARGHRIDASRLVDVCNWRIWPGKKNFEGNYFIPIWPTSLTLTYSWKSCRLWVTVWQNKDKLFSIWGLNTMQSKVCGASIQFPPGFACLKLKQCIHCFSHTGNDQLKMFN